MYLFDGVVHDALPIIDKAQGGSARGCPFCTPLLFWKLSLEFKLCIENLKGDSSPW